MLRISAYCFIHVYTSIGQQGAHTPLDNMPKLSFTIILIKFEIKRIYNTKIRKIIIINTASFVNIFDNS